MPKPIPPGHEVLIPHLVCDSCADAIEFYKKAFGAEEISRAPAPDGKRIMHAEIRVGGQPVFLVDDFPEFCGGKSGTPTALGGTPVTIHRFVEDCDAAIKQAHDAGATVKMPATDMFWGDRYGVVTDPFGHCWSLATHQRDLTPDDAKHVARLTNVKMISFYDTRGADHVLEHARGLSVEEFFFNMAQISDDSLRSLSDFPKLKEVRFQQVMHPDQIAILNTLRSDITVRIPHPAETEPRMGSRGDPTDEPEASKSGEVAR